MKNSNESLSGQYNPARIYFAQTSNRKEESSNAAGSSTISDGEQIFLFSTCVVILIVSKLAAIILIPVFLFWYFCRKSASNSNNYDALKSSNSVSSLCQRNSWEMTSSDEVLSDDKKGFIGRGEKEVYRSLLRRGLSVHHQVRIQKFYTADILCVDSISCKACIVEIDGIQHWKNPENIERDNRRMRDMAQIGVSTIRFKNSFAEGYPDRCTDEIIKLLK